MWVGIVTGQYTCFGLVGYKLSPTELHVTRLGLEVFGNSENGVGHCDILGLMNTMQVRFGCVLNVATRLHGFWVDVLGGLEVVLEWGLS